MVRDDAHIMAVEEIKAKRDHFMAELEEAERMAARVPLLRRKVEAYDAVLSDFSDNGHDAASAAILDLPEPPSGPRGDDLSGITRGEAVQIILRAKPGISPREIVAALQRRGRTNDNTHKVSNELSRLQERGVVVRRGTGRWFLSDTT